MDEVEVYLARSPMPVPAGELFAWHARPGAFERLNPPFDRVEVVERSGGLEPGARTVGGSVFTEILREEMQRALEHAERYGWGV